MTDAEADTQCPMALPDLHYKGTGWYQHQDGRYVQWFRDKGRRPTRKQVTLQESDLGLAYEEARKNARRWKNGEYDPWQPEHRGDMPLSKAVEKWIWHCTREGMSPHTLREREILMNRFTKERPGFDVADVQPEDVLAFCRSPELASSTQRGYYAKLNTFFRWCVDKGYRKDNPVSGIKPPKLKKSPPAFLTKEDFRALIAAIEADCIVGRTGLNEGAVIWCADVFRFAVGTGMRASELVHLRWRDVDLDHGRVYVREWKERGKARRHRTKSGHERSIPLFTTAREVLERRRDARRTEDPSELVFVGYRGKMINVNHLSKLFRTYRDEAKLRPELRLHSLRHTFASWLVTEGVPLIRIQKYLGHASSSQTEIYAHLIEDEHDDVADRALSV